MGNQSQANQNAPRQIAVRIAWKIGEDTVNPVDGIDKAVWVQALMDHMTTQEQVVDAVLTAGARRALYMDIVEAVLTESRKMTANDPLPSKVKTVDGMKRFQAQIKRANAFVLVSPKVSKREKDCSPHELDMAGDRAGRQAKPLLRKQKRYYAMAAQARLAGLADTEPLSKLLAA